MKRVLLLVLAISTLSAFAADKRIVFIAGSPSHGAGEHEHRAGCLLLKKCLDQNPGFVSEVYSNGWPKDEKVFDGADAVVFYADGGGGHPAVRTPQRIELLRNLMNKGVGMGCIHYAVEVEKNKGGPEFLDWIGGYFETYRSVNPTWTANFSKLPDHPVTHGVQPFVTHDEWYYHMHFRDGMKGVSPILTAIPPDKTRGAPGANSTHGGNPEVQKHMGEPEHTMWVADRDNGGRGFGVTGGHYHKNWSDENFRRVVLNAIAWIAKADVPSQGIQSKITAEDLAANLDLKGGAKARAVAATNAPPRTEPFVSPVVPSK